MNKQLIFTALCIFFAIEIFAQAGPSNANRYINFIRTTGYSYGYDHTPDDTPNRAFFILKGSDDLNTGMIPCLFDTITGVGFDPNASDAFTGIGGSPSVNLNPRDQVVHKNVLTTLMNVTMMSWGHGCGASRDFDYDPTCDFNKEAACINIDTKEGPQGLYDEQWYPTGDSSKVRMQKTWKPTYGEDYKAAANSTGPLTFGEIGLNEYRTHENGIRRSPDGAPLNLGYRNWWSNGIIGSDPVFTSSPDVTYSFTATETSYIIVSLDFPETNFDTRVYVLRDDGSNGGRGRSFGWRTDVNASNNKSVLSFHTLPAGDYFIVVEGQGNTVGAWGDYKLTVATPEVYNPGSITHPHLTVPAGCTLQSPIVSATTAETSMGELEYQWEYKLESQPGWHDIPGATSETLSGEELGVINEPFRVSRRLKTLGGAAYTNTLIFDVIEKSAPNFDGVISGKVTGKDGAGSVAGVSIIIEAISEGDEICTETFITESDGSYLADNLFYGNDGTSIEYRVTPQYLDHEFDPPFQTRTITSSAPREGVDFEDTTTVFLRGRVFQIDSLLTECPLPDVNFLKNDFPEPATSLSDGTYELAVTAGEYTFSADYMDGAHTFLPSSYVDVDVTKDTSGFDYESTTTHTVSGSITACGGFCFGKVQIQLIDDYGCFDYLLETDECGVFSATLPARNYRLEITSNDVGLIAGYNATDISNFFGNKDTLYADLSAADTVFHMVYEQMPIVTLRTHTDSTGIQPIIGCEQDTVLAQGELTTLVFDIIESNTDGCPLDTGIMMIIDEISGTDTSYHPISNGITYYDVIPDTPYLFPFEPYQHLSYQAMSLDSQLVSDQHTIRAIVTGFLARNAQFTTVSPEIPFLILRDPPGDQSYAFFEESHTTDFNMSFSAEYGGSVTAWGKAKTGAKFEAGFLGFSTESEAWGEVGTSATVSATNSTDKDLTISVTNSVEHSTESDENPAFLYGNGDLYVGAAMNIVFAKADVLIYDDEVCQDTQIVELIMGQDGFSTQFTHTESHIRNFVIPELEELKVLGPQDSIVWYQNQIDMWEQTLARNAELKEMALPSDTYPDNITFSAGTNQIYSTTNSTSETIAYEFALEVDAEFSAEVGFEVAGSGASGGVRSNFRVEIGAGTSSTELRSRKTGFVLKDGPQEPGDEYTVDVRECPVYGTPVFKLVAAETSCPYIPGTLQRDKPLLIINDPVRLDADPDGVETFFLEIYNLSEKEEDRTYILDFIDASNPNLATMNPNLAGIDRREFVVPYTGNSGPPTIQRIDITRGNNEFSYENLTFVVYSGCDAEGPTNFNPTTSSQASVSIFYESPCSDIIMSQPEEGTSWLVNDLDNNILEVELSGYTIADLDNIEVQYVSSGENTWTTATTLTAEDLGPTTTSVNMDVTDLNEGMYDIRLKLNCNGGASFTQRRPGLIDRIAPIVFGIPQPIDDNYDQTANDDISVSFEEDIACANATVLLTDMETLEVIPATLSCADNKAMVVPDIVLDSRDPAVYRVTLGGIEDNYGNIRADYRWVFTVGDYVFDPDCSPVNISNNNVDQDAISQSVYRATEITSDGTVGEATQVGYVAQESVSLESGFTVNEDGSLEVKIENCNN